MSDLTPTGDEMKKTTAADRYAEDLKAGNWKTGDPAIDDQKDGYSRRNQVRASIQAIAALAELVRELGEVPSGHLYARVMAHMSLETYNSFIGHLTNAGLVRESPSHLLTWVNQVDRAVAMTTRTKEDTDASA